VVTFNLRFDDAVSWLQLLRALLCCLDSIRNKHWQTQISDFLCALCLYAWTTTAAGFIRYRLLFHSHYRGLPKASVTEHLIFCDSVDSVQGVSDERTNWDFWMLLSQSCIWRTIFILSCVQYNADVVSKWLYIADFLHHLVELVVTEWEMHITAQGPRLRNDLYCVEWDVKLYYTIPYLVGLSGILVYWAQTAVRKVQW